MKTLPASFAKDRIILGDVDISRWVTTASVNMTTHDAVTVTLTLVGLAVGSPIPDHTISPLREERMLVEE